jgi:hypothetical protein
MNDTSNTYKGGCLCGAVRYAVRGDPAYSAHCHCRSCQKALGAGYATWSGYDPDKFKVTDGEIALCATSPGVERGFCGKCGTSLTYAGEGWDTIAITTTTLDEPSIAKPTRNVYLDHQQPWVALDESLKQSRKFPE